MTFFHDVAMPCVSSVGLPGNLCKLFLCFQALLKLIDGLATGSSGCFPKSVYRFTSCSFATYILAFGLGCPFDAEH